MDTHVSVGICPLTWLLVSFFPEQKAKKKALFLPSPWRPLGSQLLLSQDALEIPPWTGVSSVAGIEECPTGIKDSLELGENLKRD